MKLFRHILAFILFFPFISSEAQIFKPDSAIKKQPFDALWIKSRLKSYNESRPIDANDLSAKINKAIGYMSDLDFEKALGVLQEINAYQLKLQDLDQRNQRITRYYNTGTLLYIAICKESIYEYDTALQVLLDIKDREPFFKEAYNELGVVYMKKGEFSQAEIQFKEALKMYARYPEASYNLAYLYFLEGNWKQSKKYAELTLSFDQSGVLAHLLLASIGEITNKPKDAEKYYTSAYAQQPENFQITMLSAWFYSKQKRYDEAINKLDQYLKKDSSEKLVYALYANILFYQNKEEEGLAMLHQMMLHSNTDSFDVVLEPIDDEMFAIIRQMKSGYNEQERALVFSYFKFIFSDREPDISAIKQLRDKHGNNLLNQRLYFLTLLTLRLYDDYLMGINNLYTIQHEVPNFHMMEALICIQKARYSQAIKSIRHAVDLDSNNAAYNYYLGECLFYMGKSKEAKLFLDKCIQIAPKYTLGYFTRAYVQLDLELHAGAIGDFKKALIIRNDSSYTMATLLGNCYKEMDRYDSALYYYSLALSHNSNYSEALYNKAMVQVRLYQYEAAIKGLNRILNKDALNAKALTLKAKIYTETHQYDSANTLIEKVIAEYPRYPYAYVLKGNILYKQKAFKEAFAQYQQAIAINPSYTYALKMAGLTMQKLNKPDKAKEYFNAALAIKVHKVNDFLLMADIYEDMGDFGNAIKCCHRVLQSDSNNAWAYAELGWNYYGAKNYEKSIYYFNKAITMDSSQYYIQFNLALAMLRLGRFTESKALYTELVAKAPQQPNALIDGVVEDLEEMINQQTYVNVCKDILENILKYPAQK